MQGLLLKDLLRFSEEELNRVKIKFNQHNGCDNPMDLYKNNPEIVNTQWLFWNTKQRYFDVGQIAICLLKLSYDLWLLTTIKLVTKDLGVSGGISFEGEEIERFQPLFGRVIVQYHKTSQSQGRWFTSLQDELVVNQIVLTGMIFPDMTRCDCLSDSWKRLSLEERKIGLLHSEIKKRFI